MIGKVLTLTFLALVAMSCVVWVYLPELLKLAVDHALQLEAAQTLPPHGGLAKLLVGYRLTGSCENGFEQGKSALCGEHFLSHVIKSQAIATAIGPPSVKSRVAFRELLGVLSAVDQKYLSPVSNIALGDDWRRETAEGFQFLTQLLRFAFEAYVENDPTHPRFIRMVSPTIKMLGDHPDAVYLYTPVDPCRSYLITGRVTTEAYFSFTVHGDPSNNQATFATRIVATLNLEELKIEEDGTYKVLLKASADPEVCDLSSQDPYTDSEKDIKASILEMPPSSSSVIVRLYYENSTSVGTDEVFVTSVMDSYKIEIVEIYNTVNDNNNVAMESCNKASDLNEDALDKHIAKQLNTVTKFVYAMTLGMPMQDPTTTPKFYSMIPNKFGIPEKWSRDTEGMGAVDIAYCAGQFQLKEDQALLIQGELPECSFANIVLWNRFLQSFDFRLHSVSLNRKQMNLTCDGEYIADFDNSSCSTPYYRIVLSANRPPGLNSSYSWISTGGRRRAQMFWRFVLPTNEVQQPKTTIMNVADF
eukprot:m.11286 g.11286  ORF g.11286 m.11286 type:complete len:530 (-) comp4415_c0_seq1:141-1730(-)